MAVGKNPKNHCLAPQLPSKSQAHEQQIRLRLIYRFPRTRKVTNPNPLLRCVTGFMHTQASTTGLLIVKFQTMGKSRAKQCEKTLTKQPEKGTSNRSPSARASTPHSPELGKVTSQFLVGHTVVRQRPNKDFARVDRTQGRSISGISRRTGLMITWRESIIPWWWPTRIGVAIVAARPFIGSAQRNACAKQTCLDLSKAVLGQ